tara:strand:+ start:180 stop:596 length:417 start_codon:yes stop_codon:yes gene_type:complete
MNAIKYLFEDASFSPRNLPPKYKILDFIKNKKTKTDSVCFIFCSDDYLQKLNIKFLNHKNLTDVISFDYSEKTTIKGDVFISVERVRENAKTYDVKFKEELSRVIIHGILHLAGYKDKKPEEKNMMRKLENQFLKLVI